MSKAFVAISIHPKRGKVANVTSAHKTSDTLKQKKGHRSFRQHGDPHVKKPEYANWVQENFAKNYGFTKRTPQRSPVFGWEHDHIIKSAHSGEVEHLHPHEVGMVRGHPHQWKAHKGNKFKHGALRLSGHHKAHQVGKRHR